MKFLLFRFTSHKGAMLYLYFLYNEIVEISFINGSKLQ